MTALRLLAVTFGINPESLQFHQEPQIHREANWYLLTQFPNDISPQQWPTSEFHSV